jgi:molybdopterin molybdotransferase
MLIHTGGMLPRGADAVVMLEHSQTVREAPGAENASPPSKATGTSDAGPGSAGPSESEVEILRAVAVGENTIDMGEDVREGQVVIPAGRLLRPADIGGLMALGITSLRVVKKPRVGLVSSGDEIVSASSQPAPGQVRDANAFGLAALVLEHGGEPINLGIVPDRLEALVDATTQAVRACDVLVISGGSSASARDYTADAIRVLGSPGILVHGVNVKPGKPTILAVCDGKPVLGLPGNPVSALIVARLFVVPVLELLLGLPVGAPRPRVPARLAINIASQAGREDWWPVRLLRGGSAGDVVVAEPIFAKSNLIFSLAASSGLIRVPESSTGIAAGEMVEVEIF